MITDEETPQAAKLSGGYDSCLIGATVDPHSPDRFAYSLRKLVRMEMMQSQCKASEARQYIAEELIAPLAAEHGPLAPLFINDELVEGEISDIEKPIIIVPPGINRKGGVN